MYSYFEISLKLQLYIAYQQLISFAGCTTEMFKPLKDSASLLVCNEKKVFGLSFTFFVSDIISKVGFGHFGSCYLA